MVFSCLTSQISYVSTPASLCLEIVELCKDMVNRLGMRVELDSVGEISQRDWCANGYSVRGDAYVEFIIGADGVAVYERSRSVGSQLPTIFYELLVYIRKLFVHWFDRTCCVFE